MKIAIGADHRGFELKSELIPFLKSQGYEVKDFGTDSASPCDYPFIAYDVAHSVSTGESDRGILICMSGIGMSIVANKLPNVRAAVCSTKIEAALSKQHNDANIIIVSAKYVQDDPRDILKAWLNAEITEERHKKRVDQIREIEEKILRGKKR